MSADDEGRGVGDTGPASSATRLGRRGRGGETPSASTDTRAGHRRTPTGSIEAVSAGRGTELGRRDRAAGLPGGRSEGPDEVLRFGPGAPDHPVTAPAWGSGATAGPARRRRPGRWLGGLLGTAVVAAVIAVLLTRPHGSLAVESTSVSAAAPGTACDVTVDVIGTIITNGRAGTVTYQWLRNDGQPSAVLTQSVPAGTGTTQVHLPWTLSGRGRFDAVATLRVLEPGRSESVGRFTYACSSRR